MTDVFIADNNRLRVYTKTIYGDIKSMRELLRQASRYYTHFTIKVDEYECIAMTFHDKDGGAT